MNLFVLSKDSLSNYQNNINDINLLIIILIGLYYTHTFQIKKKIIYIR